MNPRHSNVKDLFENFCHFADSFNQEIQSPGVSEVSLRWLIQTLSNILLEAESADEDNAPEIRNHIAAVDEILSEEGGNYCLSRRPFSHIAHSMP
jgi:hypothetical protein